MRSHFIRPALITSESWAASFVYFHFKNSPLFVQFFVFTFVIVFQPFKALNKLKSSFNITGEMKAQRIQAQFIKKREIEHAKILQTNGKQKKRKKSILWERKQTFASVYSCSEVLRPMEPDHTAA